MDVRCEKCRTEYELDESKLKPGGVTVKCTNCGHMFKVRRRITAIGPAVSGPPTLRGGQPPAASVSPPTPEAPRPAAASASDVPPIEEGERTWLVRLEDGEILTCRELATLQKWIARGQVTRACEISRTGKKWKPLGDIGELSSFFDIADEAREVGAAPARAPTAHPHTVPRQPSGSVPAASPVSAASEPPSGPAVRPGPVAPVPEQPSGPARVAPAATDPDPGTATGAWAAQGRVRERLLRPHRRRLR